MSTVVVWLAATRGGCPEGLFYFLSLAVAGARIPLLLHICVGQTHGAAGAFQLHRLLAGGRRTGLHQAGHLGTLRGGRQETAISRVNVLRAGAAADGARGGGGGG